MGSWQPYLFNNYTGSVIYKFNNISEAKQALAQLSFIHAASDTGELITTEVIEYGYFENDDKSDVVIWGPSFTVEMWDEANEKLSNAGGKHFSSQKPKNTEQDKKTNKGDKNTGDVKFIKNENREKNTYKIYSGTSKSVAMDFLKKNPVSESFYYIIVETPEGNYARDIMGIYREDQN